MWASSHSQLTASKAATAEEAGLKWKHNALRHSFASYRLAEIQNANQVALETGHTVKVLFSNYRELVTPDEAKAWFSIAPEELGPVEIYTPERMKALLQAATAEVLPALALCGFSGLSRAEVERLDWAEVDLEQRVIQPRQPKQEKEKTARLIPILPNLGQWLRAYSRASGQVWSQDGRCLAEALRETAQKAGFAGSENGLSHSYASYRFAVVRDAQQVALETGRSPHTVFSKFNGRMPDGEAASWFSIKPESKNLSSGMRD